jgi:hypothetical protein
MKRQRLEDGCCSCEEDCQKKMDAAINSIQSKLEEPIKLGGGCNRQLTSLHKGLNRKAEEIQLGL